jgi:hypothetical protein
MSLIHFIIHCLLLRLQRQLNIAIKTDEAINSPFFQGPALYPTLIVCVRESEIDTLTYPTPPSSKSLL